MPYPWSLEKVARSDRFQRTYRNTFALRAQS